MSLLQKGCVLFESGASCVIFMLFLWFNPIKRVKLDMFVENQISYFPEIRVFSLESFIQMMFFSPAYYEKFYPHPSSWINTPTV
jgi:hypothetical protein